MIKNKLFIILPLIYLIVTHILIYIVDQDTTTFLTIEDHFFEYLSALSFLVTSIVFGLIFIHLYRTHALNPFLHKLSYLGLALIFFIGAGEEIAWGQRILHIETPEAIREVNVQGETTIHNLSIFEGENKIPFGVGEAFGTFTLILTVLVPVSAQFVPRLKAFFEKFMPIFPWVFGFLFAINWCLAKVSGFIARSGIEVSFVNSNVVEIKEANYAVLYAIIAVYMYLTVVVSARKSQTD